MSRFRVVRVTFDDGAFGYVAPPTETVVADWLTRAEAKCILRRKIREVRESGSQYVMENVGYEVHSLTEDGEWSNISTYWNYRELEEIEEWCERKGIDPYKVLYDVA